MKKPIKALSLLAVLALALVMGLMMSGCSSDDPQADADGTVTLKVGATAVPHAEILAQVKDDLAEKGIELEVVEYSDYVTPNTALNDGDLDANFFQHITYLNDFNKENGTDLASAGAVHFEPLGIYGGKVKSLDDLHDGDKVAIPNDPTNEARALLLLQDKGLITVNPDAGMTATTKDVTENPRKLQFVEAEAAALPRMIDDVAVAVINGNFALSAGLEPGDQIAAEAVESQAAEDYANVVAVKAGEENGTAIVELMKALQSDKIRDYINNTYQGGVVPVF